MKFSDHVRELIATADIWYELGIQLEVPPHILRIIRAENTSLIRCLTDMLVWLDENVQISWTKTVQALIIVDRKELARGICLKYCKYHFGVTQSQFLFITVLIHNGAG